VADITVYDDMKNKEHMFAKPAYVFKDGELVAKNGKIVKVTRGGTHVLRPEYDKTMERFLKNYFENYHSVRMDNFRISDDEITELGKGNIIVQPCQ